MKVCQVIEAHDLSPHVRRLVLGGNELKNMPKGNHGAHIKLSILDKGKKKLSSRTYTIRDFDPKRKRLILDITVNTHQGIFSHWASKAKIGEYVGVTGPGSQKHKKLNADWHLFVADLTGLPALAATLEHLPEDAKGYAVIQVPDANDIQTLVGPEKLTIQWVIAPQGKSKKLKKTVKKLSWMKGSPAIFIAAEKKQVSKVKKYVLKQPQVDKKLIYASGYWKK